MFLKLNLYFTFARNNCIQQRLCKNEAAQRRGRASASSSKENYTVASSPTEMKPVGKCSSIEKFQGENDAIIKQFCVLRRQSL